MALHLTPEMLEHTYTLLCATPPFRRWRLPPADEVEFHVRHLHHAGDCVDAGHAHIIRISDKHHRTLATLAETMAHEMCHMRKNLRHPRVRAAHGRVFKRLAAQVCRHHGFPLAEF